MAATHKKFYNVSKAVGPGQPNDRDDVELVQILLKGIGDFWEILSNHPLVGGHSRFHKVLKPIAVNGRADENLFNWIKWFQDIDTYSRSRDGVVSPALNAEHIGKRSGNVYSIVRMNNMFHDFFPGRWEHLENDGQVPGELRQSLMYNLE